MRARLVGETSTNLSLKDVDVRVHADASVTFGLKSFGVFWSGRLWLARLGFTPATALFFYECCSMAGGVRLAMRIAPP